MIFYYKCSIFICTIQFFPFLLNNYRTTMDLPRANTSCRSGSKVILSQAPNILGSRCLLKNESLVILDVYY